MTQPEQKRPQNCGTSYCSCIECVMEPDYKALWEQMCERCDELDKKLAQPEQERVAWLVYAKGSRRYFTLTFDVEKVPEIYKGGEAVPLYTTPPQRTWVGLTVDEVWQSDELMALNAQLGCSLDLLMEVVEAIEAKLKEKNT